MTQEELSLWVAYVDENGPLNPSLRIESAIARAVAMFFKGVKPRDLMPWPRQPEPEATLEDAFALFKGLASTNKGKKPHGNAKPRPADDRPDSQDLRV